MSKRRKAYFKKKKKKEHLNEVKDQQKDHSQTRQQHPIPTKQTQGTYTSLNNHQTTKSKQLGLQRLRQSYMVFWLLLYPPFKVLYHIIPHTLCWCEVKGVQYSLHCTHILKEVLFILCIKQQIYF